MARREVHNANVPLIIAIFRHTLCCKNALRICVCVCVRVCVGVDVSDGRRVILLYADVLRRCSNVANVSLYLCHSNRLYVKCITFSYIAITLAPI